MDHTFLSLQVDDFVLVELQLAEGKNLGMSICYVAKVVRLGEDNTVELTFLRLKDPSTKDTFTFPKIEDTEMVSLGKVLGVLSVLPRSTARQALTVKVRHPLFQYRMK